MSLSVRLSLCLSVPPAPVQCTNSRPRSLCSSSCSPGCQRLEPWSPAAADVNTRGFFWKRGTSGGPGACLSSAPFSPQMHKLLTHDRDTLREKGMNLCVFMNIRFSSGKTSLLLRWHLAPAADALRRGTCSGFYCLELLSSTDTKIQRKKLAFLEMLLSTEHWGSARRASWGGTAEGRRPWDLWLQGRGRAPLVNRLPAAPTPHFHKPEKV